MVQGQRRLAAIMFTDMVGYTAMAQNNESLAVELLEEHRRLLRPIFRKNRGKEIDTIGDAFLVEFASALDAVRCALGIQSFLKEANALRPEGRKITLRIGVHLGDVIHKGRKVSGDAVNVASRIEPLAFPGGVCLTEQVYHSVLNKVDCDFESMGDPHLKNVSTAVEVFRISSLGERTASQPPKHEGWPRNRIAVLPFVNMSPDPDDEFFSDGMTEELITAISELQGLQVIARTSVMFYKEGAKRISTIANELGVGTVLEGSVRKAGNKVRVTAQLIDVLTESHIWSEKYDRVLDDIFKIQDDIASNIARTLRGRLSSILEPGRKQTENFEAYAQYLKGRYAWNKRNRDGVLESVKLFQEAVRIDPSYARAYGGLADAYYIAAFYGYMDWIEGMSKARETLSKALELDDKLAEAHATLGNLLYQDLQYHEADLEFRKSIDLNPNYAPAHHWYAQCLADIGRLREGMEEIEKARELDPLSRVISLVVGNLQLVNLQLDDAISTYDKLIKNEPSYSQTFAMRSICYMAKRMRDEAYADFEEWHELEQDEDSYRLGQITLSLWFGEDRDSSPTLQDLIRKAGKGSVWELDIARYYAILGDSDQFFAWIDKAIAAKRFQDLGLRKLPFYDKVRNDPRFPEIFRRLGLPY